MLVVDSVLRLLRSVRVEELYILRGHLGQRDAQVAGEDWWGERHIKNTWCVIMSGCGRIQPLVVLCFLYHTISYALILY